MDTNDQPWEKLEGTISQLNVQIAEANFFINDNASHQFKIIAVSSAIMGLGAEAVANAAYSHMMTEEAVYLTFSLSGQPCKGWIWRNPPFQNGDVVEVVAQWQDDHYEVYAIARPKDSIIALYPHCSSGRKNHFKNAFKWWAGLCVFMTVFISSMYMVKGFSYDHDFYPLIIGLSCLYFVFGVMIWDISRRFSTFVKLSEHCFRVLNIPKPANVNLRKISKPHIKNYRDPFFGIGFFKYK